jgi:hypothetical protein
VVSIKRRKTLAKPSNGGVVFEVPADATGAQVADLAGEGDQELGVCALFAPAQTT